MVHTPAGARAHPRPRLTRVFVLQLSKGRARVISKYEMDKALSERGSLILYLDKVTPPPPVSTWRRFSFRRVFFSVSISIPPQVSHRRPEEITFRIHQKLKVGVLQPAAVSVYEYYDREFQRR